MGEGGGLMIMIMMMVLRDLKQNIQYLTDYTFFLQSRSALFQDRRAKVDKLASMMCSENFPHYLFVAKGKRLLGKCISSFNVVTILRALFDQILIKLVTN